MTEPLTEERLDAMERRCYRLDDSRITEAEIYVHQLVAEVRRLRVTIDAVRAYVEELDQNADGDLISIREAGTMNRITVELRALLGRKEKR